MAGHAVAPSKRAVIEYEGGHSSLREVFRVLRQPHILTASTVVTDKPCSRVFVGKRLLAGRAGRIRGGVTHCEVLDQNANKLRGSDDTYSHGHQPALAWSVQPSELLRLLLVSERSQSSKRAANEQTSRKHANEAENNSARPISGHLLAAHAVTHEHNRRKLWSGLASFTVVVLRRREVEPRVAPHPLRRARIEKAEHGCAATCRIPPRTVAAW